MAARGVRFMLAAHLFCEHRRPFPREIAPGATGRQEGHLGLEPKRFLFGAQTFLFSLLYPLCVFRLLNNQFFSYGGNLYPPSLKSRFRRDRNQARNLLRKFTGFDRLDEVILRAGADTLQYVAVVSYG